MGKKKEEPLNRPALAGRGDLGEAPATDCALEYSAVFSKLQEEVSQKFAPKRRRAEAVAEVYDDLGAEFGGRSVAALSEKFAPRVAPRDKLWDKALSEVCVDLGPRVGGRISEKSLSPSVTPQTLPQGDLQLLFALIGKKRTEEFVGRYLADPDALRLQIVVHHLFADLLQRRARTVNGCGTFLEFHLSPEGKYLSQANFCKDRFCPLCNWRRSLKVFSQVSGVMDYLAPRGYRYLFLTLTLRNAWEDNFADTVQALYDGWRVLYHDYMRGVGHSKEKRLKGIIKGTFRALECTISDGEKSPDWRGSFHPHLHVILAVEEDYFRHGRYLTTAQWRDIWRNCCNLDYNPQIDIQAVKPKAESAEPDLLGDYGGEKISYESAVAELSKYPLKDADFLADYGDGFGPARNLRGLIKGMSRRRLVGMTGCFREAAQALKLDDAEEGDLINVGPDEIRTDVRNLIVRYHWRCGAYVERIISEDELIKKSPPLEVASREEIAARYAATGPRPDLTVTEAEANAEE